MDQKLREVRFHAVVSDLHLGDGGELEDFVYEGEFCALLEHVARQGQAQGGTSELIINGDFIDFLQVRPLGAGPWRTAIGKLEAVASAHRTTMGAIARFVRAGHKVVILPGNHDIELHFREVQDALVQKIADGDPEVARGVSFPNRSRLGPHFRGWSHGPFAYRLPGVYVEHGNQFDAMNFFEHDDFFEDSARDVVRLPWGSKFVIELFNNVEPHHKFLDKLRPRAAAVLLLWLIDPDLIKDRLPHLLGLARDGLPTALRKYHFRFEEAQTTGSGARGASTALASYEQGLAWLGQYAHELEIIDMERDALLSGIEGSVASQRSTRGWSRPLSSAVVRVCQAALDAMTARPDRIGEDDGYKDAAIKLACAEDVDLVVLGHTHGLRDLRVDGRRYLNSGTWIGLLDWDPIRLRNAAPADYAAFLRHLREAAPFVPAKLLTFVEISYPYGTLNADLRIFRDGVSVAASSTRQT